MVGEGHPTSRPHQDLESRIYVSFHFFILFQEISVSSVSTYLDALAENSRGLQFRNKIRFSTKVSIKIGCPWINIELYFFFSFSVTACQLRSVQLQLRVSMGLSVWRETSKKLTVCREKGKKLTVCRDYFCSDNRVVCRGSQWG